ncbi:DUF3108 domain-containing protein [Amphritea sp. HPY]|uniref:DUF3108 domain-containing protein n=1 Tax=Amphritea sp. HPY TaxID=3421652 RepID=UPI003D7EBBA0
MRIAVILSALLMLLALPGHAATPLKPYRAVYASQWDLGISFSGDAVRELKQQGDNWQLSISASAMIASIKESSSFSYNGDNIQPSRYEYHRKVLGKKRDAILQFNWNKGSVLNDIAKKPWSMDIPAGTMDKLGYQLQLRLDLLANKPSLEYQVADGGRLKTYNFRKLGEETVKTRLGEFRAVKIQRDRGPGSKRQTYIWLAPELDYLIVKLHQTETDGKEYTLLLEKLEQ